MVAHCGLWCTLLLCALACLWSRCGHDFESSGPHGRGSGPTCLTVWERTEEPTDSGIFPRGPPSLWVSYTSGVWACEAPVYVFSILSSPTWVLVNERGSGPTCLTVWERTGEWTDFGAFPRGPPSLWVSYTSGVWACEAPVYVFSILSSPMWVLVNERGSGPACLTVWERTGEWTDFGAFPREPPSLWVSYTSGVGACEAPVCVFSILFSRRLVHRADSVQQLSVSGRGSGPTCLAVCELNDFGGFPRGPPSLWVSYTSGVGACEAPVCVFSILFSRTLVHRADSVQQLSVSGRGSGPTCLAVCELNDFGVFPRGPPSLWVSYTFGVGACEAPVCVFSILFSRTLVHRADSVQQLSVSGRGSGPTCLAVCELNDFGVFPRGPPSLWVSYAYGFGVCESPVCIFSILSRTWVHGANDVQLSVSGRGRLLVHVGLVTVTGTTVSSSYPNNNLTMASELERKRTACKGWATRSANSSKDYLQRDDITKVKLGELISDFDKRLEALDCVQTQVEMSFEDLDALLADIEVSGNYRDSICETRLKALECFEKLSVTNPLEADVTSVTSTGTADVKLPKLSLPKFSGDVLQWQSFWDQFTAVVDSSDIPDISKFSYLRSLLEGEAKQSIQGLSLTSQHYQSARQILTDRFGRKERIIFTHIQTLLNMPEMNKCSVSNLWKLNDDLQSHTRSLEALGICGTQYGVILTPLILSRLPQEVRLEWSREGEGHESDLSYLLKFLEKEILRRERSQVFKDTVQVSSSVPEAQRFKAPPTAAALQTASMNVKPSAPHECGVCGKNHPTDRCFKLLHCNGSERRERVQREILC